MNFIYTLSDPRTDQVRYVGKTKRLAARLRSHLLARGECHRSVWIRMLKAMSLEPKMTVVEEVADDANWEERERFWISHHRLLGCVLTNFTDGGDGGDTGNGLPERRLANSLALKGRVFTDEHRKHLSLANTGRKLSAASIKKMADAKKGRKLTEEHRRKIGFASRGKPQSPLQKQRLMEANTGRHQSEETRQKIREARENMTPEQKKNVAEAVAASNRRRAQKQREAPL